MIYRLGRDALCGLLLLMAAVSHAGGVLPAPDPLAVPVGPWKATVVAIHDGDTCRIRAILGFGVSVEEDIRIEGIDSPELRVNRADNPAGLAARDYLTSLIPVGSAVRLRTPPGQPMTFARRVGSIEFGAGPYDVGATMLQAGYATPYPPK